MALLNLVHLRLFLLDKEGSQHILKHSFKNVDFIKLHGKISLFSLGQNQENHEM